MNVTSSNYEEYRKIYCQYMYDYFEDYFTLECDYCDIRGKCEEPTKEHIEKLNKWVENHIDFVNSHKHILKSEVQENDR